MSHPSGQRAKELAKQSDESGRGLCDTIGFSSGFPAVETPWSHRCWLEFKINWVSILFHMLRECLSIRLVRTGEGGPRTYPSFNTQLPGGKGREDSISAINRTQLCCEIVNSSPVL